MRGGPDNPVYPHQASFRMNTTGPCHEGVDARLQALGSTRYPQTLLFRVLRPEPHGLSALVTGFLQDTLPTISNGTETLFCCVTWQPTDAAAVYSCAPPAPGKCPKLFP
jgi:hypothetical protein